MNISFKLGKRLFNFSVNFFYKNYDMRYMRGKTNRTKDGMYCVFMEYDHILLEYVQDEVKRLQEQFMLGDFVIVKSSSNSYHCYCFDKVFLWDYLDILSKSSVDPKWRSFPLAHGTHNWVLRYTAKTRERPSFVRILRSTYKHYEQSRPHILLFEKLLNVELRKETIDKEQEMYMAGYYI